MMLQHKADGKDLVLFCRLRTEKTHFDFQKGKIFFQKINFNFVYHRTVHPFREKTKIDMDKNSNQHQANGILSSR